MKLPHQRLQIKRAFADYRAHPTPENHRAVMRAIEMLDHQRKESNMKKIAYALCVLALVLVAACDPNTYVGNTSANAGTGSGSGGYCGGAAGVPSK